MVLTCVACKSGKPTLRLYGVIYVERLWFDFYFHYLLLLLLLLVLLVFYSTSRFMVTTAAVTSSAPVAGAAAYATGALECVFG